MFVPPHNSGPQVMKKWAALAVSGMHYNGFHSATTQKPPMRMSLVACYRTEKAPIPCKSRSEGSEECRENGSYWGQSRLSDFQAKWMMSISLSLFL